MAFPVTIDSTAPAATDSPGSGDDELRSLKQAILDLFGITSAVAVSAAILSLGSLTDGKIATAPVQKGASPLHGRVIGTEGSAVDFSWREDAGVLYLRKNTGTEAVPVWTNIVSINLTTGDLSWSSGTTFTGTLAHAATANRTYTFPDADATVLNAADAVLWGQVFG